MFMTVAAFVALMPQPFALQVTPVYLMEGGPVVLDARVVYGGLAPVSLKQNPLPLWWTFPMAAPAGWPVATYSSNMSLGGVSSDSPRLIRPGETVCEARLALHQRFVGVIPAGRAALRVDWAGARVAGTGRYVTAAAEVELDIPEFKPPHSTRLVAALTYDVDRIVAGRPEDPDFHPDPADPHRYIRVDSLPDILTGTAHPELAALARRLVVDATYCPPGTSDYWRLRRFAAAIPESSRAFDARDVAACEAGTAPADGVLGEWHLREWGAGHGNWAWRRGAEALRAGGRDRIWRAWTGDALPESRLSDAHLKRLMACRSVWLRLAACHIFRHRLPPTHFEAALRDLTAEVAPIHGQTARWLADLGHPEFRRREAASRELLAHFPRTRGTLEAALNGPLSPEARDRAGDILRAGDARPVDPYQAHVLRWLPYTGRWPELDRLRAVLVAGDPGHPAVKVARDAHAARQAPPPSPPAP